MFNLVQPQRCPIPEPAAVEIRASDPRSLGRPVVTHGTTATGVPGMYDTSGYRVKAPILWQRLPSKRVKVDPCSPLRIGNSRTVQYL